jgi:hypothetical protein
MTSFKLKVLMRHHQLYKLKYQYFVFLFANIQLMLGNLAENFQYWGGYSTDITK